MISWSLVIPLSHGPLLTVQATTVTPGVRSVMVVLGLFASAITPDPLTTVQEPMAGKITALPVSTAELTGVQNS